MLLGTLSGQGVHLGKLSGERFQGQQPTGDTLVVTITDECWAYDEPDDGSI